MATATCKCTEDTDLHFKLHEGQEEAAETKWIVRLTRVSDREEFRYGFATEDAAERFYNQNCGPRPDGLPFLYWVAWMGQREDA